MVEADLDILLDKHAPKRLINHWDPVTRRSRHSEFVRSVRATKPFSIENHASSSAPQPTIDQLGVLVHAAEYKNYWVGSSML